MVSLIVLVFIESQAPGRSLPGVLEGAAGVPARRVLGDAGRVGARRSGFRAATAGHLPFASTLVVILTAGPRVAAGSTRVFVHDREVGHLAPLREVVQAGLVAGF